MNAKQHIAQLVEQALAAAFPEAQGLPAAAEIEGFLEVPPDRAMAISHSRASGCPRRCARGRR